jgi:cobalamin-dependent methionine synthase I
MAGPRESILPAVKQATTREATRLWKVVALMLQMVQVKKTMRAAMMVGRFPKQTAVGVQKMFPTLKAKTG